MTWRFFCRINDKAWGLNPRQIISSADLGGSSNYSKETFLTFNFEDWSGESFHDNGNRSWVSRS